MALLPPVATLYARRVTTQRVAVWLVCHVLLSPVLLPVSLLALLPDVTQAQATTLVPIPTIQGAGHASPLAEQMVTTWGVVTGVTADGFYLQDPAGDGDMTTSDGLYAFTYSAPTVRVGECVQVMGEVTEYYAKTELNWLTGITPSAACALPNVTPVNMPRLRLGDDPVAILEAYEGMVVQLEALTATVHSPTKHFAGGEDEIAFLPVDWQRYLGQVHIFHDQAEVSGLLYLSNRLGAQLPLVQWGDMLQSGSQGLVGVLDYNFGKYQLLLLPDQALTVTPYEVVESALPLLRVDEYGVCSYNLHGLGQGTAQFPNVDDYAAALRQRAQLIATWLDGCTVLALQETGTAADAEALAATLAAAHGLTYQALAIEGPNASDEAFPLTNSLLVDATRVSVEMVEAVAGCTPQDFGVFAPGACVAGNFPLFDRPPLLAKLVISGPITNPWAASQTLWVINNHWKSKSGDESFNARLRAAQAQAVAARVQAILTGDADAQVVVLGDLNDFYGGEAVAVLQAATGLFQPYEWLPPLDRYTYIFNGTAQVLDHALVTPNLAEQLSRVEILHIQADTVSGANLVAHSDHDPVVLRVRPGGAANIGGTLGWGALEVYARDGAGAELARTITDAQGEFRLWGLPVAAPPITVTLAVDAPAWIVMQASAPPLTATVTTQSGLMLPALPPARHVTAISGAWIALHTPWLANRLTTE